MAFTEPHSRPEGIAMIRNVLRTTDCSGNHDCPTIYELADGRLAVQGDKADAALLAEAGVPDHESVVIVPRSFLPEV